MRAILGHAQLPVVALALFFGCKGEPRARVLDESEEDYVGATGAGAETYDRLITASVEKLLQKHSAAVQGLDHLKVAYLGVENQGVEEIGDWQEHLYELIDTSISAAGRYQSISRRFVEVALRETRLKPDELFLPDKRQQFIDILKAQGNPIECLLFSKITTGSTQAHEAKQRNYLLTLELVDLETGYYDKVSERVRKVYK